MNLLDVAPCVLDAEGCHEVQPEWDRADPRWPVKCESCDYRFVEADEWQVFADEIYLDEQGAEHSHRAKTPGMMYFVPWYYDPARDPTGEIRVMKSQGNHYLSAMYWRDWAAIRPPIMVNVPNGDGWCVDATANNGPGWTVTGEAPLLTCTPSIQTAGYHGFLGSSGAPPGYFKDC